MKKDKLDIIYEDKYIIIINKPSHMLTISTESEKEKTLFHKVIMYEKRKNKNNKVFIVHRLDKDTSGLVIFAKNQEVKNKLIKYVEGNQEYSAIDNYVQPIPTDMPGYSDKIIMASGSFIQGSSIEISCDGPIRSPFIAYMQGGLTYQMGRLAVINAVRKVYEER